MTSIVPCVPAKSHIPESRAALLLATPLIFLILLSGCSITSGTGQKDQEKATRDTSTRGGFETTAEGPSTSPEPPETTESGKPAPSGRSVPRNRNQQSAREIKGVYMTAYTAGSPNLDLYLKLIDRTELNAVVVDVKDVTGEVMYPSRVPLAQELDATRRTIPDLESLARRFERRDVYTIARIATFQDNILPREREDLAITDSSSGKPWRDYAGNTWTSPYDREVWEYNVAVAKEAAKAGFDEVQFDYVRFPSDGPMDRVSYAKKTYPSEEEALAGFLQYAQDELGPFGTKVGADVFGLAATEDGARVGQYIDTLAPHLDVISPMVYPSHFPPGSYGYEDPNSRPYEMVGNAIEDFKKESGPVNRDLVVRPWLQDFDLGEPDYGPEEVQTQMRAAHEAGASGWLLWNQANVYTRDALKSESGGD